MTTLFTPTYNRAYILPKLYESLCVQTFKDFEWLVVDDGSTDNTEELIASYIAEAKITIRYIKQKNGGKHRAINRGAIEARGELFSIVDSDDYLTPEALSVMVDIYNQYKQSSNVVGFLNVRRSKGSSLGSNERICTNMKEFLLKYPGVIEYWHTFRTSIIREYPFPDVIGENFCSESLVFNSIASNYDYVFFGGQYYLWDYINDGLTVNSIKCRAQNPQYAMLTYENKIKLSLTPIRSYINYWRFYFHCDSQKKHLRISGWMSLVLLPMGFCLYLLDLYKLR